MKPIEFHPEAEQDLLEAIRWYRDRSEVAAQAFALEIDHAIEHLAEAPTRWRVRRRKGEALSLTAISLLNHISNLIRFL